MLQPLDPAGFPPSPLPADRVRGPAVFLDYDQAELDAVYDQNVYAPNRVQVLARCRKNLRLCFRHAGGGRRFYAQETFTPDDVRRLVADGVCR